MDSRLRPILHQTPCPAIIHISHYGVYLIAPGHQFENETHCFKALWTLFYAVSHNNQGIPSGKGKFFQQTLQVTDTAVDIADRDQPAFRVRNNIFDLSLHSYDYPIP